MLPFHKQKLLLHRASMKYYADFVANKTEVEYIQSIDNENLETVLIESILLVYRRYQTNQEFQTNLCEAMTKV